MTTTDNSTSFIFASSSSSSSYVPPELFSDCLEWREAQDVLYQVANLFFAVAFLIPDDVRFHVTLMRATLCLGCACLVVWGGVALCQVDVLVWYLIFLSVNVFHLVYALAETWPTAIRPELRFVYANLFAPLRMNRSEFKELTDLGKVKDLPCDDIYAVQGGSVIGESLSLVLSGRLKVTRGWLFLHSITANQFIDSPEFHEFHAQAEYGGLPPVSTFQVNISAMETSRILSWNVPELQRYLDVRPYARAVMTGLLGRDVTRKLCQVHELFLTNPQYMYVVTHHPPSQEGACVDGVQGSNRTVCRIGQGAEGNCNAGAVTRWDVRPPGLGNDRTAVRPRVIDLPEKTRPASNQRNTSTGGGGGSVGGKGGAISSTKPSMGHKTQTPIGPYSPSQVSFETFV